MVLYFFIFINVYFIEMLNLFCNVSKNNLFSEKIRCVVLVIKGKEVVID